MTRRRPRTPAIAKNRAHIVGATAEPPGPVDLQLDAAAKPVAGPSAEHQQLACDHDRDRPARQQLEATSDDHARDDQQAVEHGVQQRPQAAVLAGDPSGDAVERSRPQPITRSRPVPAVGPVAPRRRRQIRNTGISASRTIADRVGDRPRAQRLVGRGLLAAADRSGRARTGGAGTGGSRGIGRRRHSSATPADRGEHVGAPSGPRPRLAPAPELHLDLARLQRAATDRQTAAGQPSSSASANFSPGARLAVVVEHVDARPRAASS